MSTDLQTYLLEVRHEPKSFVNELGLYDIYLEKINYFM